MLQLPLKMRMRTMIISHLEKVPFNNILIFIIRPCGVRAVSAQSDIPEAKFPGHVRTMHEDRDHGLELEFKVCFRFHSLSYTYTHSLSPPLTILTISPVTGQTAPASQ